MNKRHALWLAVLVVAAGLPAASGTAAGPPPPPKAISGARVDVLARGLPTPTAFAFGQGTVFVGAFGSEDGKTKGGVFVVRGGSATPVDGLPQVAGLAWKNGTLYGTAFFGPSGFKLLAWSGWNGTRFAKTRVVFSGAKGFPGLNGLAIGWNGRIYAGVSLTDAGDHSRPKVPYANSILSMRVDGGDVQTVATGLRQPWQLAFVKGVASPYVTVLGQENLGKKQPPDYVIVAQQGQDYGFPVCNWSKPALCKRFATPFALLPAHSSPTGIAAIGSTLYLGFFAGTGRGPEVATLSARGGGSPKPFLTGFAAPVIGVGASGGYLYVGDVTGTVYRVRA